MKKGISLIVLVITIIVMIIIAGAIIISLNSSNVLDRSNEAVKSSNLASAKSTLALKYAEILAHHYANDPTIKYVPGVTESGVGGENVTDQKYIQNALDAISKDDNEKYIVKVEGKKFVLIDQDNVTHQ